MKLLRVIVSGAALSLSVCGLSAVATDAHAQTTSALEYFNGASITAKAEHVLVAGQTRVPKGAKGKVIKVHKSGSGKILFLDVKIGNLTAIKIPVETIRSHYARP